MKNCPQCHNPWQQIDTIDNDIFGCQSCNLQGKMGYWVRKGFDDTPYSLTSKYYNCFYWTGYFASNNLYYNKDRQTFPLSKDIKIPFDITEKRLLAFLNFQ